MTLIGQWINIYNSKKHKNAYWTGTYGYKTKAEAVKGLSDKENYLTTINIVEVLELQEKNRQLKSDIEQYHSQYKSLLKQNEKLLENTQSLAKLVLKLSPERKEWLEKHYGEYL